MHQEVLSMQEVWNNVATKSHLRVEFSVGNKALHKAEFSIDKQTAKYERGKVNVKDNIQNMKSMLEGFYTDMAEPSNINERGWLLPVKCKEQKFYFKLDTGAESSILPDH